MPDNRDIKFMQLALKLAGRGIGSVEPNPAVGCVIVKSGWVIGKGFHKKFGGPHAEVNALKTCKKSPRGATMYVTLEPCCHFGKTPPCTDAIIKAGIKKVVAAIKDPTKKVNGRGFEILKEAGIKVVSGICKNEAEKLNAAFFKFARTGKPWVIIKWAQSADGFLARKDKKQWITNLKSRKDAHKLRRRVQGILVGVNTVIADDPLLTVRPNNGKKPLRIVLDSFLKTPLDCKLLATAKKVPVLIATSRQAIKSESQKVREITEKGAELLAVPAKQGELDLKFLLRKLAKRGIVQLLVEGGAKTITSFLKQKLADRICIYVASKTLGDKGSVKITGPMAGFVDSVGLYCVDVKRFGKDIRISGIVCRR
jgi:diaminohydroxyphosphoribosylaminopyrimidine deaminase/5-amino-6-(5-phosphoribosylamino)uracil reductase